MVSPRRISRLRLPERGVDLVFRHASCADGAACEWLARRRWPNARVYELGARARVSRHLMLECKGKTVLFLDVAPPAGQRQSLAASCEWVGAVEHHASTREADARGELEGIDLLLDERLCAASLLWDLLHAGQPRPKFLDLVNARDTWQLSSDEQRADSWSVCTALSKRRGPALVALCESLATGGVRSALETARWASFERACKAAIRDGFWTPMISHQQTHPVYWVRGHPLSMASDLHYHMCRACAGHVTLLMTKGSRDQVQGCFRGPRSMELAEALGGGGHTWASGFRCQTHLVSRLIRSWTDVHGGTTGMMM